MQKQKTQLQSIFSPIRRRLIKGKTVITNSFYLNFCLVAARGGSRVFSRGGGADFQKKFENLDDLFFRSTKLIFRALPKHCFAPNLAKFSAPQANF